MKNKEYIISALHKLYRRDPWINELFNAAGVNMDKLSEYLDEIFGNNYFDTATENKLRRFEAEADIVYPKGSTILNRRSALRAKWVGSGKATLALLQSVADSWENGLVTLSFEKGKIHVTFNSPVGVPDDLDGLENALGTVKPAHLAIYYTFLYYTWQRYKDSFTWQQVNEMTWNGVRNKEDLSHG